MLHVIHQRSFPFEGSHLAQALADRRVPFQAFSAHADLKYRTRAGLLLRIYPTLAWNTLRLGLRSLLRARPAPDAVVVNTEIEALLIGLLRTLLRRRTLVVLQTLIITPRHSPRAQAVHTLYWRCILRAIDLGICHSRSEAEDYRRRFPRAAGKFVVIPFGLSVDYTGTPAVPGPDQVPVIVSAGRSGRDFPTLVRAIEGLRCRLTIICDRAETIAGIVPSDQVTLLTRCFEDDYLQALASASFVAVPLSVDGISVGQMVFLQAAALGRAVVMTRTATTAEYAADGEDAILVPMHDIPALRAAIKALLRDPALVDRLGTAARALFRRAHSTGAYVDQLLAAIAACRALG